ncbi:esterase/lipase family protein [Ideonella sp.]|uniref:esterase/lipase family protein n=1 Tax=Ideonella sp. TaxID=1929293 RepID=UPI0035B46251
MPVHDNDSSPVRAPGLLKLALEGRAPWEFAALLASAPWLRQLPAGDGHPVIVFPGLGVSDFSTVPMRNFLRDRGFAPQPWRQGFNFGPREGVLEGCVELLQQAHARTGQKVSLIGWSLGGVYARELAKQLPDLVRCVITLGSPFGGHPRATNAWRFFELVSGKSAHDPEVIAEIRRPPPVPTTSVYSRTDGVVAWQCSLNPPLPHTENIELQASHVGMGMNPLTMYLIADRLRQPEGAWQPFEAAGVRRWFFKPTPGDSWHAAPQAA